MKDIDPELFFLLFIETLIPNLFINIFSSSLRFESFEINLNFFGFLNKFTKFSACLTDNFFSTIFLAKRFAFSKPTNTVLSQIYDWYSFNILPKLGELFANDSESYKYLAESIRMHPAQEDLKKMIIESGFKDCNYYNLLNGIVAIHVASK